MDPNGNQCSIDYPYNDNAVGYHGLTLPRSFTLIGHGRMDCGTFPVLSITLSPGKSFTLACREIQAYGILSDLSIDHSRDPILDLFSLASIWGNSRALILSIICRNQTRILFLFVRICALFSILLQCVKSGLSLKVPYTVIRAHSLMSETFALPSDYLKDLYSFCFTGADGFQCCLMDEFYSRTAQLKSRKEKNKGACCAY